ncbi:hypothetical protein ACLQ2N_32665 [Streptomyces sp. DT224]|uniref:hypothetical protein n=1 Tax=Streptomyces sp. DT224 TaxID=3393426 RepID=UPI003CF53100
MHALPHLSNETGFAAVAEFAARQLDVALGVLGPAGGHFVQQHSGGGARVRVEGVPAADDDRPDAWAWARGDVKNTLADNGIMTWKCERSAGTRLGWDITLPTAGAVRLLTALIKSGMNAVERAALALTLALNEAGIEVRAAVDDDYALQPLALNAKDALTLWKLLRGPSDRPAHIDISTWSGLDKLAGKLMRLPKLAVLIEAQPGCDNCHLPNQVVFGALTADEAQSLAAAVARRTAAAAQPTTPSGGQA